MQCAVAWTGPFLVSLNLAGEITYLDPARWGAGRAWARARGREWVPAANKWGAGGEGGSRGCFKVNAPGPSPNCNAPLPPPPYYIPYNTPAVRSPAGEKRVEVGHAGPAAALAALPGGAGFLTGGDEGLVLKWGAGAGGVAKVVGPDAGTRSTHAGKVVGVAVAGGSAVSVGFDDKVGR